MAKSTFGNGHHAREQAWQLMGSATRVARWLLPWVCVLVSWTLAEAAGQALMGDPRNQAVGLVAAESAAGVASAGLPAEANTRWVQLASDGEAGSAIMCLAPRESVSADVLNVRPAELPQLAANLCRTGPKRA